MPGTALTTEKDGTVPKINVVLALWELTYDESRDPSSKHYTWPGSFPRLRARKVFFSQVSLEMRPDLCIQEGVKCRGNPKDRIATS